MPGTCSGGSHMSCGFFLSLSSCSATRACRGASLRVLHHRSPLPLRGRLSPLHELVVTGIDDPRSPSFWIGMGRYRESSVGERGRRRNEKGEKIATCHGSHRHMYLACGTQRHVMQISPSKTAKGPEINRFLIVEGPHISDCGHIM